LTKVQGKGFKSLANRSVELGRIRHFRTAWVVKPRAPRVADTTVQQAEYTVAQINLR
jgi:hypothetical protein